MATSLPSTLTGFHGTSQLHSQLLGASFNPLSQQSFTARVASSYGNVRRSLVVAAIGGASTGTLAEDEKPSMSSTMELKKDLSLTTIGVAAAVDACIFLTLSPQTAISCTIGAFEATCTCNYCIVMVTGCQRIMLPTSFRKGDRTYWCARVFGEDRTWMWNFVIISMLRIVIPAALYSLWAFSTRFTGTSGDSFHLEVTLLILGFFACKAAALVQAYRENKDLLFIVATGDSDSL